MRTHVLVADSVGLLRLGVRAALERAGGFVVSEARDESELLAALELGRPDLVLLDLHLPPFGAIGFLTKDMKAESVVRGLHTALEGQSPIRRSLLTGVIGAFQNLERRDRYGERAIKLSSRELEVLGLIALGTRNREIAVQLDISEFTVKRHVQNILHKLNVPSRDVAAHIYRSVFGAEGTPQFAVTV